MAKKAAVTTVIHQRLKKANEAILIRPTSGRMTFLSRKIFNALLYHAQQQGAERLVYQAPLSEFTASIHFDSKDTMLLREHLKRMTTTSVEWHDPRKRWGTGSLLGEAEIIFDGRNSVVEWSYTPKVKEFLLDPDQYTPLSLQFQALFETHAALVLFEICSRYATNPTHVSNRASPEWWYPILSGNPEAIPKLHFYRYFKRDIIQPAMKEINRKTNLTVELIEHTHGRKVLEIQFEVGTKAQAALPLPAPPLINAELIDRIVAFGIARPAAEEIYGSNPEERIRSNISWTEERIRNSSMGVVHNPAGLFKDALEKDYAAGQKQQQKIEAKVAKEQSVKATKAAAQKQFEETAMSEKTASEMEAELSKFDELPKSEQDKTMKQFRQENPLLTKVKGHMLRMALAGWLLRSNP